VVSPMFSKPADMQMAMPVLARAIVPQGMGRPRLRCTRHEMHSPPSDPCVDGAALGKGSGRERQNRQAQSPGSDIQTSALRQ
jgi:hypothetical protein